MNTDNIHALLRRVILALLALVVIVYLGGETLPVTTQSVPGNTANFQVVKAAPNLQVAPLTRPRLVFVTAQNLILTQDLYLHISLPVIEKGR